jgi:hypothetical protein
MAQRTTTSTLDPWTTTPATARTTPSWRVVKLPICELCRREAEVHWPDPRLPLLSLALCRGCQDRVAYMAGWLPKGSQRTIWSREGVTVLTPSRPWPRNTQEAPPRRSAARAL